MNALEEINFQCPYCGENMSTLVDISAGSQQYVEDCQVCCSPIIFDVETMPDGNIQKIITRRENE